MIRPLCLVFIGLSSLYGLLYLLADHEAAESHRAPLASCFRVVRIVVAFWRILFTVRCCCSGAALVRIWRIASELFRFHV